MSKILTAVKGDIGVSLHTGKDLLVVLPANNRKDIEKLLAKGTDPEQALRSAGFTVFVVEGSDFKS